MAFCSRRVKARQGESRFAEREPRPGQPKGESLLLAAGLMPRSPSSAIFKEHNPSRSACSKIGGNVMREFKSDRECIFIFLSLAIECRSRNHAAETAGRLQIEWRNPNNSPPAGV